MQKSKNPLKNQGIRWRRERDLNPRAGTTDLLVFEARPFSHLGTSPQRIKVYHNSVSTFHMFFEKYEKAAVLRVEKSWQHDYSLTGRSLTCNVLRSAEIAQGLFDCRVYRAISFLLRLSAKNIRHHQVSLLAICIYAHSPSCSSQQPALRDQYA